MVAQTIKNQIEKIEYREKAIFGIFFSLFIFLLFSYGFMINKTISNAVAKQQMEKEIIALNSDVNSMESGYLSLKNDITIDFAIAEGFVVNTEEKYAMSSVVGGLSLSINEN